ncbi:hypothetical protein RGU70_13730 [Herbaspirillum sp. RTI4]|uniref:hypothetical protein n=1 Tax=Herbaspirillum sp. RTI4 TaxID=3048640 RepID=UPI002AB59511|nr:hypothetical protein [Herbaspirillum sp. RTI4]MDY7579374.1 hypothetical protein [Herbaspirillum sp. RTI4]MEA9980288.1 hypothetical protein [Herbaspirillum sp. RTI4]
MTILGGLAVAAGFCVVSGMDYQDRVTEAAHVQEILQDARLTAQERKAIERSLKYMTSYDQITPTEK